MPNWRPLWELYQAREVEAAIPLIDPELEWHTRWPGLESAYHGHDGFRRWAELVQEPMDFAEIELLEVRELDGERVFLAVRLHGRGRGSGAGASMDVFDIWTFRNGKLLRRETYADRAEALAAAGVE